MATRLVASSSPWLPYLQNKPYKCESVTKWDHHLLICDRNNSETQRQSLNIRGYPTTPTPSTAVSISFISCFGSTPSLFVPETSSNSQGTTSPGYFPLFTIENTPSFIIQSLESLFLLCAIKLDNTLTESNMPYRESWLLFWSSCNQWR